MSNLSWKQLMLLFITLDFIAPTYYSYFRINYDYVVSNGLMVCCVAHTNTSAYFKRHADPHRPCRIYDCTSCLQKFSFSIL
jgi:hypothetical protein